MRLNKKNALITGAASGFGREIARVFAKAGAHVALVDLNADGVLEVAEDIGENALGLAGDVTSPSDMETAVHRATEAFGGLDIVVNNAGYSHRNQPLLEVSEADYDRVFAVNVKSIFVMAHAVIPQMRAAGHGVMINVSSTAAESPRAGLSWYNASKGAVNTLTKSLAAELAPDNIRVNALAPVLGETGLTEVFMGGPNTPENRRRFLSTIPLGRLSQPIDIANAALFLASEEANFLTGVILPVDGGRTI